MLDLFVLLIGLILVATGLWWMWPALCLLVLGIGAVLVAYLRWSADQKEPKAGDGKARKA